MLKINLLLNNSFILINLLHIDTSNKEIILFY